MAADPVTAYARRVVAGKLVAGRPVRLACERHLRDQRLGKQRGLEWRPAAARRAVDFFAETLVLDGGAPFVLDAFQVFIVGSLFGWYGSDGSRRFRTAYVEIGKGNGKTPTAAGIGLYALVADGEGAPEVYSAATTRDQAGICWRDALGFVQRNPELSELVSQQVGSLTVAGTRGVFRPVSSEHKGLDGLRVHVGLIDELHEHPSALVVDKIRAGTKARRQALIFEITNSGFDRHSVCWQHHEYSLKVLEGVIENDSWFAYVCALDEGDDWRDTRVWLKANPGLGTILPRKYLEEQVREAEGMPSKENIVRRLNFCEWTEQSVRAIQMDDWDRGAVAVDAEALRGKRCYFGLDLARVSDLSALLLMFPPDADCEAWRVLPWFWVPEDDIARRSLRDRVPYDVWAREGLIHATPGNTTDFDYIAAKLIELAGQYQAAALAYDRTFAGELIQTLQREGLPLVEFGQGMLSMAAPTAELLRLVKAGQLHHGGHPVLRWCASNLSTATDAAGNMKPDKERSVEKIDGIVAMCNALGVAMRELGEVAASSVYDSQGIEAW